MVSRFSLNTVSSYVVIDKLILILNWFFLLLYSLFVNIWGINTGLFPCRSVDVRSQKMEVSRSSCWWPLCVSGSTLGLLRETPCFFSPGLCVPGGAWFCTASKYLRCFHLVTDMLKNFKTWVKPKTTDGRLNTQLDPYSNHWFSNWGLGLP